MNPDARIETGWLRAVAVDTAVLVRALEPGQRLVGRVLQVTGENQFLLSFGDRRMIAQSALPLVPGQPITVEVVKTGALVELRMLQAAQQATAQLSPAQLDERLALAALITAVRQDGQTTTSTAQVDPQAVLRALLALKQPGRSGLPTQDLDRLASLLSPVPTDAPPAALAGALRAAFERGGLLFEARLRQMLDANPGLSPEQTLEQLKDDARVLLGRVLAGSVTEQGDAAGGAQPGAGKPEVLVAQMLARQAEMGLHWVADGTLRLDVPVRLPSGDAEASILVRRDPEHETTPAASPAFSVTFRITSPMFGAVDTRASWRGRSFQATISVERDDTRVWLDGQLESLKRGLASTFSEVHADVRVDPARALGPASDDDLPDLPSGSIVNVRA